MAKPKTEIVKQLQKAAERTRIVRERAESIKSELAANEPQAITPTNTGLINSGIKSP